MMFQFSPFLAKNDQKRECIHHPPIATNQPTSVRVCCRDEHAFDFVDVVKKLESCKIVQSFVRAQPKVWWLKSDAQMEERLAERKKKVRRTRPIINRIDRPYYRSFLNEVCECCMCGTRVHRKDCVTQMIVRKYLSTYPHKAFVMYRVWTFRPSYVSTTPQFGDYLLRGSQEFTVGKVKNLRWHSTVCRSCADHISRYFAELGVVTTLDRHVRQVMPLPQNLAQLVYEYANAV